MSPCLWRVEKVIILFCYSVCNSSIYILVFNIFVTFTIGERGGSVVECRTPEREVRGSRPTAAVLCP